MEILKLGQIVTLMDKEFCATKNSEGFYLKSPNQELYRNDVILEYLDKDKKEIQKSSVGYCREGVFPYCDTIEDLTDFVNAIKVLIQEKELSEKKECPLSLGDIVMLGKFRYKVMSKLISDSFFMKHLDGDDDGIVFEEYHINRKKVSIEITGEYKHTLFPVCKSLEELHRLNQLIVNEIDGRLSGGEVKISPIQEKFHHTLKYREFINLFGHRHVVEELHGRYHLISLGNKPNDIVFDENGFDRAAIESLSNQTVGYYFAGGFPEFKNTKDLTDFVNAFIDKVQTKKKKEPVKIASLHIKSSEEQTKYIADVLKAKEIKIAEIDHKVRLEGQILLNNLKGPTDAVDAFCMSMKTMVDSKKKEEGVYKYISSERIKTDGDVGIFLLLNS